MKILVKSQTNRIGPALSLISIFFIFSPSFLPLLNRVSVDCVVIEKVYVTYDSFLVNWKAKLVVPKQLRSDRSIGPPFNCNAFLACRQ
ncbi:magnesium transporter MRS2-11, chloroplastic-like isoform X1 [Gossypium australe]|uniref:Magnesium transporter MRS2-11, chloroplastic-like isoform X1 n=1 Tax=Gossypium australe TaxID=47621 RepID=A0A5B6UBY1_9ROSI|nr:magnesium transporter MRS2-11, chloroplastic-like isoform X1 [Gossypium australe]